MEPFLCANQHQGDGRPSCTKEGTKACSVCKLVLVSQITCRTSLLGEVGWLTTITQYCSKECQVAHWSIHKVDCKSPLRNPSWKPAWEVEQRAPTFLNGSDHKSVTSHGGKKYLWGNVPAIDLLQLAKNEGKNTTQDLHLLLAGTYFLPIQASHSPLLTIYSFWRSQKSCQNSRLRSRWVSGTYQDRCQWWRPDSRG